MGFDLGTLDSGERSLPFGLLVFYVLAVTSLRFCLIVNHKNLNHLLAKNNLITILVIS